MAKRIRHLQGLALVHLGLGYQYVQKRRGKIKWYGYFVQNMAINTDSIGLEKCSLPKK